MTISSVAVPVPAAVGVGASADVSALNSTRTLIMYGIVAGDTFMLEGSDDDANYVQVIPLTYLGQQAVTADFNTKYVRIRRYSGASAPTAVIEGISSLTIVGTVTANQGTPALDANAWPVKNAASSQVDGHSVNIGTLADADTASTLTGLLKKVKALLNGGLPAALAANGGLKIEGVAGGVPVPVSGTTSISGHVDIQQDVTVSAGNSSTTQLDGPNGYTFTGSGVSTLGVNSIQVCVFADKNLIVKVQQDATNTWTRYREDTVFYTANSRGPTAGFTVQAVDAYVRVVVTSMNETTTTFRIDTVLCPVVEAIPRALDVNGNFKVALQGDTFGNGPPSYSINRELLTTPRYRLVGSQFDGSTIDSNFWSTSTDGGTVSQAGQQATITSGVSNGKYARLYTVARARYVTGMANLFKAHIRLDDTGTANVKRRWGVAWGAAMPTITDGAYFELDGTSFSIVTLRGTSESRVSSGSFNGVLGYTYSPTTNNTTYEILYSNGGVSFIINGQLLHKVTASGAPWTNTLNLHVWLDVVNSGNSGAVVYYARMANICRVGELSTQQRNYYFPTGQTAGVVLKYSAGNIRNLVILSATNNSVITLYDNTAASGTVLVSFTMSTVTTNLPVTVPMDNVQFSNGLTLVVATQNASVRIGYE